VATARQIQEQPAAFRPWQNPDRTAPMPGREDPRIVVNESKGSGYPIKPLHGGIEMIDARKRKSKASSP
jgi:hypothetical protein